MKVPLSGGNNQAPKVDLWPFLFVFVLMVEPAIKLKLQVLYQLALKERCNLICWTWLIPSVTFSSLGNKTSKTFNAEHADKIVLENYCVIHSLATAKCEMFSGWQQIYIQSIQVSSKQRQNAYLHLVKTTCCSETVFTGSRYIFLPLIVFTQKTLK